MTVSFCVIAYNEEKALRSLFSDIQSQDYPHDKMEVVFVNAMSTDRTRQLMEEFAAENHDFIRVTIADNPKRIQSAGWNVAIKESREEIIMRIDAHTLIPSNFVSNCVACILDGEDVVGGPRPNIIEGDTPWKQTLLLAEKSMFGSSIAPYRTGHHKSYVKSVFHGAYRREVFEKAGTFNENLGRTEDNEMHYRIRQAGYKICYNPKIISYQHTRSTWKGMIRQKYGNGRWIGLTMGVCPQCFSVYHVIPLLFVVALAFTLLLAAGEMSYPLFALGGAYILADFLMSVVAIIREKKYWQYVLLPVIFLSLHLSYGVGTMVGVLYMPFWKHKIQKRGDNYSL